MRDLLLMWISAFVLLWIGAETGFWDDQGRPAPWPDDIDEWRPAISEPQQQPF